MVGVGGEVRIDGAGCEFRRSTPHPAPLPDRGGEGIMFPAVHGARLYSFVSPLTSGQTRNRAVLAPTPPIGGARVACGGVGCPRLKAELRCPENIRTMHGAMSFVRSRKPVSSFCLLNSSFARSCARARVLHGGWWNPNVPPFPEWRVPVPAAHRASAAFPPRAGP